MKTVGSLKSFASLCLGEPCGSVHNEVAIQFLDLLRRYLIYTQPRVGKIFQTRSITGIHKLVHAMKHTQAKRSKKIYCYPQILRFY